LDSMQRKQKIDGYFADIRQFFLKCR